ncbi:MAG: 50S ribosomal protein L10 [Thermoflexales bacterium]|nr:50S ribosomal protein L10 [Thermoflexales bacterium]MDW8350891.1 50S ribosomal protein L10 [Anaerolineae bacterium]
MAISREKKEQIVAKYAELIGKSQALIITRYGGLKMPELDKVRSQMRGAQAEFHVTKNTLIRRALKDAGYDVPPEWLTGTTAMSFCFKDPPAVAKALGELTKELEKLTVVGGVISGKAITKEEVEALASLPSLETLRAQIIGAISAPAAGLVSVLNAAIGGVMYALQAKIDKETPKEA